MAIAPKNAFPGKIDLTDLIGYPEGKARDVSTPSALDGTPWVALLLNDLFGFQQALLKAASPQIVPSGSPDKVGASQYLQALNSIIFQASVVVPDASEGIKGILKLATQVLTDAGLDDLTAVTPLKLKARLVDASEALRGLIELATQAETNLGLDDLRAVTPLKLKQGYGITRGSNANGSWTIYPDGFIEQRGILTTPGTLVTFPISFVSPPTYYFAIVRSNSNGSNDSSSFVLGVTATTLTRAVGADGGAYWYAEGY